MIGLALYTCFTSWTQPLQAKETGFEKTGNYLLHVPLASSLLVTLLKSDLEGTLQLARSALVVGGMTELTKRAFNNTRLGRRPDGGQKSFVSGHASWSCAGAAFLGERYGWKYGLPALAIAATVSVSRVQARRHYTHDVIAGCAMSYLVTELFVTGRGKEDLYPVIGPKFLGFRWKFDL